MASAVITPMRISLGLQGLMVHLFDAVGFVGVFDRGHQPVDDADQQDAGRRSRPVTTVPAPHSAEAGVGLLEQFDGQRRRSSRRPTVPARTTAAVCWFVWRRMR